jgi:outer membrane protein assembly factor BamE
MPFRDPPTVIRTPLAPLVLLAALLPACSQVPRIVSEYKIDVQQGNVVSQEMVAQLKPGMSKDQVRFALGTPLMVDPFHANRWDYVYRLERGRTGAVESRNLSVFFDDDGRLQRLAGDVVAQDGGLSGASAAAEPARPRVIDLGTAPEGAAAPPVEGKGFFGRMLDKVGL